MYGNSTSNLYENMVEVSASSAMTSIRNMTVEQLNDLLYSDAKIDNIIDNLPQVRSLPSERDADLAQNKSLAEWNLAQEPRLQALKADVRQKYESAMQLKNEVEELHKRLESLSAEKSLEVMGNVLQVAVQEVDDEAEEVAKEFVNGDLPYALFIKDFLEKKTLAHTRRAKSERLQKILREQQYEAATPHSRPSSMPAPPSGRTPYPELNRHSFW